MHKIGDLVRLDWLDDINYGIVLEVSGDKLTVFLGNGLTCECAADAAKRVPVSRRSTATSNFAEILRPHSGCQEAASRIQACGVIGVFR
jgi:hypothetical protein